jgi:hypothetical protein
LGSADEVRRLAHQQALAGLLERHAAGVALDHVRLMTFSFA